MPYIVNRETGTREFVDASGTGTPQIPGTQSGISPMTGLSGGVGATPGTGDRLQALKQLFGMSILSGAKKPSDVTSAFQLMEGQAEPADLQKRKRLLQQASPVVGQVIDSARKAPTGVKGAFLALVGKIPGVTGGEAEFLSRDIEGFARLIASVFASEVGVATDKDVQRWLNIMPRPGDTASERKRQSQMLINRITSESNAYGMAVPPEIIKAAQTLGGGSSTKKGGTNPSDWEVY